MLEKIRKFLYLDIFVNISVGRHKTNVYVELVNHKGEIVKSDSETFDVSYLSNELYNYIESFTKESPFFYISILDSSVLQGAIPTCAKNNIEFYYDISASEYKCYDEKWIYHTAKTDIYELEKVYAKIGVDFIFSPFLLVANFFKDKINSALAMFVLVEDGYLCLSVFDHSELLYAEYLDMQNDDEYELMMDDGLSDDIDDDMMGEDESGGIDLDNIDSDDEMDNIDELDELDELDDFGDIDNLDFIEEVEEFSEDKDDDSEFSDDDDSLADQKNSEINEDYQRFSLIQSSVSSFYKDEKFKSEFIENIYIADSVGVSSDLKQYLEEEMFLNVYIRRSNAGEEICKLAKMELS